MKRGVIIFWSIFVAASIFRVWQTLDLKAPDIGNCLSQIVTGVGTISEEPSRTESGQVLVVYAQKMARTSASESSATDPAGSSEQNLSGVCKSEISVRMKAKLYPRFAYSERVFFTGKLLRPANFQSGTGRTFDYKGYLAKDDVFYEMKSAVVRKNDSDAAPEDTSLFERINSWLYSLKGKFVSSLDKTLGEPQSALASGLVVGEKAALGKGLLADFRTVGLIHIVVLSGYNITIVADAMRRILAFLPRVWGISIGGIGIFLFGIMVGGGATVVRSCVMAAIALSADLIRRDYNVVRALMFAALVMLIQDPMILLHDPSFQLSFLATLGLVLLASPVEKRLKFITEKFGIRGIVASTIATQIFVSPYILYMMGQISIIGMVVNILVLPFIPATMLSVFITGFVGIFSVQVAQIFGWISHLLLAYELAMVQNFARLPFAAVSVPVFSGWWVAGFYLMFTIVWITIKALNARNKIS